MRIFRPTLARFVHDRAIAFSRLLSSCPFQVLGLKNKGAAYAQVQTVYRELALRHHPDVSGCGKSAAQFIRIKDAFHSIVEGPSGIAVLRHDHPYKDQQSGDGNVRNEGEVNIFPQDEHNWHLHPSVNPQVLHEIADISEKKSPGGLDRGGMWQYANMISKLREKSGGDGLPPLRVEGGSDAIKQDSKTRKRSRRRRA